MPRRPHLCADCRRNVRVNGAGNDRCARCEDDYGAVRKLARIAQRAFPPLAALLPAELFSRVLVALLEARSPGSPLIAEAKKFTVEEKKRLEKEAKDAQKATV